MTSGSSNYLGRVGSMKKGTQTSDKKITINEKKKDLGLLKKVRKQERLSLETRRSVEHWTRALMALGKVN